MPKEIKLSNLPKNEKGEVKYKGKWCKLHQVLATKKPGRKFNVQLLDSLASDRSDALRMPSAELILYGESPEYIAGFRAVLDSGSVPCGKGHISSDEECHVGQSKPSRRQQARHLAEHLGENVAAWKTGKVIGGAISALAAHHGIPPEAAKLLSETAVQALASTLLHARKPEHRGAADLATKFTAEATAAFAGKVAHEATGDIAGELGTSEYVRTIASMGAGKGVGLATNISAHKTGLAGRAGQAFSRQTQHLKRIVNRGSSPVAPDSHSDADTGNAIRVTPEEAQSLLDLTVHAYIQARRQRQKADAIKCGEGYISEGEKCHVGEGKGGRFRRAISAGNERERRLREAIKTQTGFEVPSRRENAKEAIVAAAGLAGGFHGHVLAVAAPVATRAILEAGQRIYDARTAKIRTDLIEQIEKETAKELAGGIVGEAASTAAGSIAKNIANAHIPGAATAISLAASVGAGFTAGSTSAEPLAKAALKLKRMRKDNDEILAKLQQAIAEDTGMNPDEIVSYRAIGGKRVLATYLFGGKPYQCLFSPQGASWQPLDTSNGN